MLRKFLMHPKWDATPIMLSGNTDCYQPAEQKYRLTRKMLEVCNEFNQPVGILTKNSWILKDKDVLQEMAKKKLYLPWFPLLLLMKTCEDNGTKNNNG